jgi:hypothetical protein
MARYVYTARKNTAACVCVRGFLQRISTSCISRLPLSGGGGGVLSQSLDRNRRHGVNLSVFSQEERLQVD